ncbi:DUF6344 domain-containing protein [Streptomyces sp. NPDC049687]|uniref:DUF6344 domain-containing protein n=1 Tax=Streptomyces sp. NPDC049687 TaxID=3365596 RepID=UPI0037A6D352
MSENRVKKLWTALVTAFLALCTALGFVASTATTATAQAGPTQTGPTHTGSEASGSERPAATTGIPPTTTRPSASPWDWFHARSLPPTMKQRIRAEAHGKSPSCRHRPLSEAEAEAAEHSTLPCDLAEPAEPSIPLQR